MIVVFLYRALRNNQQLIRLMRLCLNLGKLDGSAFFQGLLRCDCNTDGLKAILAAYGNICAVENSVYKCLGLCDECIVVSLKEEVCRLRGLNSLGCADESFVLKMVVVLDSTLLAENLDTLVIAVRSLAAVVDDADCAVRELQGYDCSVDIVIIRIAGICGDRGSRP